jgi:SAM-dependent methyltransferase
MGGGSAKWSRIESRYRQRRQSGKPGWTDDYADACREMRDFLARNQSGSSGRFLELGCGAGNKTLLAARMGLEAFGVDASHEAVAWASARAAAEGSPARFRVGDIVTLAGFLSEFFDVVFDGGVLYMIVGRGPRAQCFENIARVLAPGGLLYASAHLVDAGVTDRCDLAAGIWYDPLGRFSTIAGEPAYHFSTEEEFTGEIEQAGLSVLKARKVMKKDPEHPFYAGDIFIDARKPRADGT